MWGTCLQTVSFVWRLSVPPESWGKFFSCWKLWFQSFIYYDWTTNDELKLTANSADPSLNRPSYTRSFHIIQSALFNSDLLFFFQIWRPQRRTGYRLWKGEILDVIKQITGSWYSWIGIYHFAFGDSEVQSCALVTFLLQLILSIRTKQLVLRWEKVVIVVVIVVNLGQIRLKLKLYEKKRQSIHPSFLCCLSWSGL